MPQSTSSIFFRATGDFGRAWRQLLITDIVFRAVAFVLLTPVMGLLLRLFVATTGRSVVADTDLVSFFVHPIGIAALVVMGAVSLAIVGFGQAGLMIVGFGAAHGRAVRCGEALAHVASRWRSILALTTRIVARALLIAAPFLAAAGLVFVWLLGERDIYFYISTKPPELWLAAGLIGSIVLAGGLALGYVALGWLLALPVMMFEDARPADALAVAGDRVAGRRTTTAFLLVGWLLLGMVLSSVAAAAVIVLGHVAAALVGPDSSLLLVAAGAMLLFWGVANFVSTFVSAAASALLLVGLYSETREEGPQHGAPERDPAALDARRSWTPTRTQLVVGLVAAVAASALVGVIFLQGVSGDSDALVTAHRGASAWAPENTLAAVERAIVDGADFVEIDVQETVDGRVVVFHDDGFKRLAGIDLNIWDATYAELQDIDVGSWFAPEFADQRVPSLERLLETARGRIKVNIELKYYGHEVRLEDRVVEIVEEMGMASEIVIMTFDYDVVQDLKARRPEWEIGLLSAVALGDLTRANADFFAVSTRMATPAFVRAARRAGKGVKVWTVNDPVTAFAMIARGVDDLIADDPVMIRNVLRRHAEMSEVERLIADIAILIGALAIDDDEDGDG